MDALRKARVYLYIFIFCFVTNLKGSNAKLAALIRRVFSNYSSIDVNIQKKIKKETGGTCKNSSRMNLLISYEITCLIKMINDSEMSS